MHNTASLYDLNMCSLGEIVSFKGILITDMQMILNFTIIDSTCSFVQFNLKKRRL